MRDPLASAMELGPQNLASDLEAVLAQFAPLRALLEDDARYSLRAAAVLGLVVRRAGGARGHVVERDRA